MFMPASATPASASTVNIQSSQLLSIISALCCNFGPFYPKGPPYQTEPASDRADASAAAPRLTVPAAASTAVPSTSAIAAAVAATVTVSMGRMAGAAITPSLRWRRRETRRRRRRCPLLLRRNADQKEYAYNDASETPP